MSRQPRMKLVAYLKTGPTATHAGGWRHPAAALHDIFDPRRYEQLALTLGRWAARAALWPCRSAASDGPDTCNGLSARRLLTAASPSPTGGRGPGEGA